MDSSSLDSAELQKFLEGKDDYPRSCLSVLVSNQEKNKAMINQMVGKLTEVCWDKCISSTPGSKFSSSEANCLTNCAQRYFDLSVIIVKRFQSMP